MFAHRTHRPAQHVGGQVAAGNVGANQHPAQPHHPCRWARRRASFNPTPSRALSRRAEAANPTPPPRGRSRRDNATDGRQRYRRRADARVPSGCSRPSAARVPRPAQGRAARTSPGSCAGATGWGRPGACAPRLWGPAGSETSPAASRSANALRCSPPARG